jgi:hypothetical protein
MLRPCRCGHKRSNHKYIYYGQLLSNRSPCKECNIEMNNGALSRGIFKIIGSRCMHYAPLTNLQYLEAIFDKKQEKVSI